MKRSTLLLLALLLLAAALRFYRIDAQSLWSDEGSSVVQATRDVPGIIENAARDIHPPLYYILLHFWVVPFGTSESGVRSLSAVLGVALVLLCYLLARQLWDERSAVLAAALAALNPFQIVYAQEARMYMLMTLLGALCVYATIRALTADGRQATVRWLLLYLLSAIMGLYTHYLFPIVLAVCNLIVIADLLSYRRTSGPDKSLTAHSATPPVPLTAAEAARTPAQSASASRSRAVAQGFTGWVLVQAVVLLAFAPWLPTALRQLSTWPAGAQTFTATAAPLVVLRTLSEGASAAPDDAPWLAIFAVCLLAGLFPARRSPQATRYAPAGMFLFLLAPIAVMFALALFKDAFLKFLLVASPPFVLLVAHGIVRLSDYASRAARHGSRGLGFAQHATAIVATGLLLLVAVPSALSVQNYYFDPRFARDDYRSLAQAVGALAGADDAIVLDAPGQQEIFSYYYHGSTPVYPLPRQRPIDVSATQRELETIAAGHRRIFAVLWATDESDPSLLVESWFSTHTFKAGDQWYGNVRLLTFASARTLSEHPVGAHWDQGISLLSYVDAGEVPAVGDVMPLTLVWRAEQPIGARYKVFVHLLDPRGFVIAQRDSEPVGGTRPTTTWQTGETIRDDYGLLIPFGTPPYRYQLEFGLYDPDSGQRLRTTTGADHLTTDAVPVRPAQRTPPLSAYNLVPVDGVALDGLQLLGYRLDKLGAEGQADAVLHPGDALHLALFWRKNGGAGDHPYRLTLGPLSRETSPTDGFYPVALWGPGEVVRDDQVLALPGGMIGRYPLTIDGQRIADVLIR